MATMWRDARSLESETPAEFTTKACSKPPTQIRRTASFFDRVVEASLGASSLIEFFLPVRRGFDFGLLGLIGLAGLLGLRKRAQSWKTFLNNHVGQILSVDFFTVPTITLKVLYVFVVLAHRRREVLHFNVTDHPTAESIAQQVRRSLERRRRRRRTQAGRRGTRGHLQR
jgi:hypothetical protein